MNMHNNVLNNQNQFMKFNNGYNNINNFMNFNNNNNNFNNFPNNNMNNFGFMNNINNNNFGGFNNLWMNQFNNINNLNWKMNNINLNNNNMNLNINNNQINSNLIKVYFKRPNGFGNYENFEIISSLEEKVSTLIDKYRKISNDNDSSEKFIFNEKRLNNDLTLSEAGVSNGSEIFVVSTKGVKGGGPLFDKEINIRPWFDKEINIKFIKISKFYNYQNNNPELIGLLKLCLLKEVSQKISYDKVKLLPDFISVIIKILSIGYIATPNEVEKNIKEVLEKLRGSNIINFSNYVDEIIDSNHINQILSLLSKNDFKEMNNTRYLLSKYNKYVKLFNKEFEISKKESIFEFSLISLVVIEREDFERFEKEREKCPHRVDKILYHGTSIEPISKILTGLYRKSLENKKAINGKGVYFTELLDYGWYYGGEQGNRANFHGIPKVGDTFTVIINSVYYDRNGFEQVKNGNRTPGKNQVNFAYAGARSERIDIPDRSKFYASEYVIYDLDQICPFMSAKFKRVEYCVIWRDNNFSQNPVFNNKFDEKFKKFLKERMKYINQNAKYNIYPCETTEEALKLVNRKKYNKIILISNVGTDLGGKKFIDKARQIIGNDVITLFLAYKESHLNWIKNYKNAIFSNEPKFYEEYLRSFEEYGEYNVKYKIKKLIGRIEKHYKVKFNFDDKFLDYPLFKEEGKYSELRF